MATFPIFGFVLLLSGSRGPELAQIATIETPDPVGVYQVGSEFKALLPVQIPSEFVGVSAGSALRFDLVAQALRCSKVTDNRQLWQVPSDDAVVLDHKVYNLAKNILSCVTPDGQAHSRRKLPCSDIRWTYLDDQVRFVAGFRKHSSKPNSWPLVTYDLSTKRVGELPIEYDLGGLTDINLVSTLDRMVVYDEFRTYMMHDMRLVRPSWLRKRESYYTIDATVVGGRIYLLQGRVGSLDRDVMDASNGQILVQSEIPLQGFVKGNGAQVLVYSYADNQLIVFAPLNASLRNTGGNPELMIAKMNLSRTLRERGRDTACSK